MRPCFLRCLRACSISSGLQFSTNLQRSWLIHARQQTPRRIVLRFSSVDTHQLDKIQAKTAWTGKKFRLIGSGRIHEDDQGQNIKDGVTHEGPGGDLRKIHLINGQQTMIETSPTGVGSVKSGVSLPKSRHSHLFHPRNGTTAAGYSEFRTIPIKPYIYLHDYPRPRIGLQSPRKRPLRSKFVTLKSRAIKKKSVAKHTESSPQISAEREAPQETATPVQPSNSSPNVERQSFRVGQEYEFEEYNGLWSSRLQLLCNGKEVDFFRLTEHRIRKALASLVFKEASLRKLHLAWDKFQPPDNFSKMQVWQELMIYCMQTSPLHALKLFLSTSRGNRLRLPKYILADCLVFLAQYFLGENRTHNLWSAWALHHLASKHLIRSDPDFRGELEFPDELAILLFNHGGRQFLDSLLDSTVTVHPNTVLHFLDASIDWGDISLSLRLLRQVVDSGFDLSSAQVQAGCVKLLKQPLVDSKRRYRVQTDILTKILEMGIRPEVALVNRCLTNAVDAEDIGMMQQLYKLAKENGVHIDAITYGILIKGARIAKDSALMHGVLKEIEADPSLLRQEPVLLSEYLSLYSSRKKLLRQPAFSGVLEIYQRYCRLEPLVELGICQPSTLATAFSGPVLQWPTHRILGQLIFLYVVERRYGNEASHVYENYHRLVAENHPLIAPLSQSDLVANAFIIAFQNKLHMLPQCVLIVRRMLKAASKFQRFRVDQLELAPFLINGNDTVATNNRASRNYHGLILRGKESVRPQYGSDPPSTSFKPSPPTVMTWSLLIGAYLFHNQKAGAKRILTLMRERRLRPTAYTWNTLIEGYSKLQDIEATVRAVKRMKDEGYDITTKTVQSLGKIRNQERLLNRLHQVIGRLKSRKSGFSIKDLADRIRKDAQLIGAGQAHNYLESGDISTALRNGDGSQLRLERKISGDPRGTVRYVRMSG